MFPLKCICRLEIGCISIYCNIQFDLALVGVIYFKLFRISEVILTTLCLLVCTVAFHAVF